MGGADVGAVVQALRAHDSQNAALAPVVVVDLVAGVQLHAGNQGLEAVGFGSGGGPCGGFPLGLAGIHKCGIALAVALHLRPLLGGQLGVSVFGRSQQALL